MAKKYSCKHLRTKHTYQLYKKRPANPKRRKDLLVEKSKKRRLLLVLILATTPIIYFLWFFIKRNAINKKNHFPQKSF